MRKLTVLHKHFIVKTMRDCIVQYTNAYLAQAVSEDEASMYAEDIAYNCTALQNFIANNCCDTLQEAIMEQDTAPREEFVAVLRYVAEHKLVDFSYV
jgi:hypothetical protein